MVLIERCGSASSSVQIILQVGFGFALGGRGADIATVGLHQPRVRIVCQCHFKPSRMTRFEFGRGNRRGGFDAAEEVAPHPIRAGDKGIVAPLLWKQYTRACSSCPPMMERSRMFSDKPFYTRAQSCTYRAQSNRFVRLPRLPDTGLR